MTRRKPPSQHGKPGRPTKVAQMAKFAKEMQNDLAVLAEGAPKPRRPRTTPAYKSAQVPSKKAAGRILNGEIYGALATGELHPDATPLDVMIEAMRQAYKIGGAIMAAPYAKEAAPYVHAKINPIDLKPKNTSNLSETPVKDIGLHKFLVEYVDTIDVEAKEVPDGDAAAEENAK